MHNSSRAPVLSATLSLVSAWITPILLAGLLQHLDQAPPLGARQRPGLGHADDIALVGLVRLVVGVQRAGLAHDLPVHLVASDAVDPHGDRLVRLARDDDSLARLALTG